MGLVDLPTGEAGDQRIIANLIAKARDHRGDLGVEKRARHIAKQQDEDFDVLPCGMKHLHHIGVGEQYAERGEVDSLGLRIHHRNLMIGGKLHQAELWPIGAFTHEFGVDGHECFAAQPLAECCQRFSVGDELRLREIRAGRTRHPSLIHRKEPCRKAA